MTYDKRYLKKNNHLSVVIQNPFGAIKIVAPCLLKICLLKCPPCAAGQGVLDRGNRAQMVDKLY